MTAWPSFLSLPTQGRDLLRPFRSQISGPYPRITSPGRLAIRPYDMFFIEPRLDDQNVRCPAGLVVWLTLHSHAIVCYSSRRPSSR